VQAAVYTAVAPMTPALAASMPPLYALVAGIHSVMPFLARLLLRSPWTATITAGVAGVLVWPFSAVGPLVLVVFLTGAIVFDVALPRGDRVTRGRLVLAAALAAVALFLIALPVFSPQHLTAPFLLATLLGRLVGECAALGVAVAIARALRTAGVRGAS
jgi:hypothetical protein